MITTFPPSTPFPVYKRSHWYSDKWQAPEMAVDLNRSFFSQLKELQNQTPHFQMLGDDKSINSDFCDDVWECKDCYFSRSMAKCEKLYYSYRNLNCKNSFELTFCFDMEESYDCVYCMKCYNTQSSIFSRNCIDSAFLYDCRNCTNCFMSWNLRNAEYTILNKKYSKEEYERRLKEIKTGSRENFLKLKAEFDAHLQNDAVHRQDFNVNADNCEGNYLEKSKNCENCYLVQETENVVGALRGLNFKDSTDISGLMNGELCSGIAEAADLYNVQFAIYCFNCSDSQYIESCYDLQNCFGCVGLKKKKFCILNKEYPEAEYWVLREKIITKMKQDGEYGKLFSPAFAYNGYNASLAAMYFPLSENEAKRAGYQWEVDETTGQPTQSAESIPDQMPAVQDIITQQAFACSETSRPFKFIPQEIDFHRRHQLPLSTLHPDVRGQQAFKFITATTPQAGTCSICKKEIVHYYHPEWGFKKIICNEDYEKVVL